MRFRISYSQAKTVREGDSHCFPAPSLMPLRKPNIPYRPSASFLIPLHPDPGLTGTFLMWPSNRCSIWAMSRFCGSRKNWMTSRREFSSSKSRVGRVNHSLEVKVGVRRPEITSVLIISICENVCRSLAAGAICICTGKYSVLSVQGCYNIPTDTLCMRAQLCLCITVFCFVLFWKALFIYF